jgi:AcrR family transcriptional regulator
MNQHSYIGKEPKTKRGRQTRNKLLQAAEIEFGDKGYHEAAISGITGRAGVALGTFYIYFSSKEEIFRALVAHMGVETRHWIAERVGDSPDRLTAERQGIEAFIEFVRRHPNVYRIVTEAQFVAEDAYRNYYTVFADAYREQLSRAGERGEIRDGDYEVWSWALIGMSVFLGMRFAAWDDARTSADTAAAVADLIRLGMGPLNHERDS